MAPNPLDRAAMPALALGSSRAFYFSGEDGLRLTSFNSVAGVQLALEGRFLTLEGRVQVFQCFQVPNTDRTPLSTSFPMGEGWLLDVQVRASAASPRRGQTFVSVGVVRGLTAAQVSLSTLLQGYVTDTSPLAWPGSLLEAMASGPGVLRSITGTDPAAGAEISETVPANARWRLQAIQFTFVTGAAVANREVGLTFDDGATVFAHVASGLTHVAATSIVYSAWPLAPRTSGAQDATRSFTFPPALLPGGFRLNTVTTNFQAADDYGAPQCLVEEWIED